MLKERTKKGLEHARKEGRIGGRKPKLKEVQRKEIKHLIETKNSSRSSQTIRCSSGYHLPTN